MTEPRWRRVDHVVSTPVDDGIALLDLDRGVYFAFNVTAAAVWRMLEEPVSQATIEQRLRCEFDVPLDQCANAVTAVLERFADEALVRQVA